MATRAPAAAIAAAGNWIRRANRPCRFRASPAARQWFRRFASMGQGGATGSDPGARHRGV